MTEDQAKTKLCVHQPFERSSVVTTGTLATITVEPKCLGSQCMAWRWSETAEFKRQADLEFVRSGKRVVPTDGYCGLAGKPE